MKKFSLFFVLLLILLGLGFFFFSLPQKTIVFESQTASLAEAEKENQPAKNSQEEDKIILMAVGDIMLDRGVEYMVINNGNFDFKFPFFKIKNYLDKADILFGNLESVISNKGEKEGSIYSFRAEPRAMEGVVYAGFDVVSVANNHSFDYGEEAFLDSLVRLKNNGVEYLGGGANEQEAFSLKIKEIKGTKIGFLAYSNAGVASWKAKTDKPGIAFLEEQDKKKITAQIAEAKKQVDILAVSIHWGDEYVQKQSASQISWAKSFLDAGADIVIGHHPHVPQQVVKYGDKWAAYSLGNFLFDQYFSQQTMAGLLLEVVIEGKKIKEVSQKQIKMNDFYQPELSTADID